MITGEAVDEDEIIGIRSQACVQVDGQTRKG